MVNNLMVPPLPMGYRVNFETFSCVVPFMLDQIGVLLLGHPVCIVGESVVGVIRADQNTGGALWDFPTRTAMCGKSRFSSAICLR